MFKSDRDFIFIWKKWVSVGNGMLHYLWRFHIGFVRYLIYHPNSLNLGTAVSKDLINKFTALQFCTKMYIIG